MRKRAYWSSRQRAEQRVRTLTRQLIGQEETDLPSRSGPRKSSASGKPITHIRAPAACTDIPSSWHSHGGHSPWGARHQSHQLPLPLLSASNLHPAPGEPLLSVCQHPPPICVPSFLPPLFDRPPPSAIAPEIQQAVQKIVVFTVVMMHHEESTKGVFAINDFALARVT